MTRQNTIPNGITFYRSRLMICVFCASIIIPLSGEEKFIAAQSYVNISDNFRFCHNYFLRKKRANEKHSFHWIAIPINPMLVTAPILGSAAVQSYPSMVRRIHIITTLNSIIFDGYRHCNSLSSTLTTTDKNL